MIIQVNKINNKYRVKKINKENIELQTKTANDNGTITPDTEYYGLDKVIVDAPIARFDSEVNETIDVLNYSEPVEITPSEGKNGMEKWI